MLISVGDSAVECCCPRPVDQEKEEKSKQVVEPLINDDEADDAPVPAV